MADIHGVASFPGVLSVESCSYTISHGISPAVAILKMHPQDLPPDEFGDLIITDGFGEIIIPEAKVNGIKVEMDDRGFYWSVEIADRRWRWKELGIIGGCYNQLDPFGKLIAWTIRSPTELAILCLEKMGETNYTLDLPPGINYPGPTVTDPITNISGVNPPVNWDNTPPAQALQHLADRCGCRIIYRLSTDSILIGPIGEGDPLPDGSIAKEAPAIKAPEVPDAVGVAGAPTRYQVRLGLIAVGEEWDGSYRAIDLLSYAPLDRDGKTPTWNYCNPRAGATGFTNVRATDRLTKQQAIELAARSVYRVYQIVNFDVSLLTDPNNPKPVYVPGYGTIQRIEQLVLQNTQVDQITPQAGDKTLKNVLTNETANILFYNGTSKDKPAQVFGSVYNEVNAGMQYTNFSTAGNTVDGSLCNIPFQINAKFYQICFSGPAWFAGEGADKGKVFEPTLVLQTAVLVRDPVTNAIESFLKLQPLNGGGNTNPLVRHYPDVQANVTSTYDKDSKLLSWSLLENDPLIRAQYYLDGMAKEFQITGGLVREYNGIVPIDLDGLTQQVTWTVDGNGASTRVSQNCEHSIWISPYPARRRAEGLPAAALPANKAAAAVSTIERVVMNAPPSKAGYWDDAMGAALNGGGAGGPWSGALGNAIQGEINR